MKLMFSEERIQLQKEFSCYLKNLRFRRAHHLAVLMVTCFLSIEASANEELAKAVYADAFSALKANDCNTGSELIQQYMILAEEKINKNLTFKQALIDQLRLCGVDHLDEVSERVIIEGWKQRHPGETLP